MTGLSERGRRADGPADDGRRNGMRGKARWTAVRNGSPGHHQPRSLSPDEGHR